MRILVINSGSSSIKFKLFDMNDEHVICKGLIEQIGERNSHVNIKNNDTGEVIDFRRPVANHGFGIDVMNELLAAVKALHNINEVSGVGHRVVQGADFFEDSVIIDDEVMEKIEELIPLAPLHNPAHLAGMRETLRVAPRTPNIAVFDTVFHQTMPKCAYMYPLPIEFYEKYKVRRYGAHGTSHQYAALATSKLIGVDFSEFSCISLHIGSGSSMAAIKNGKCIDTTMGLTPLEGLMMGTRCGSIDPAIVPFLMKNAGLNGEEIDAMMNKKSGLLAIGGTNDMREIEMQMDAGDEAAKLAFDMFIWRIKKYIGAYIAILGHIDAISFTAGIGENDSRVRAAVCGGLEIFGIHLDEAKNSAISHEPRLICSSQNAVQIAVIPADEELAIARDTKRIIEEKTKEVAKA